MKSYFLFVAFGLAIQPQREKLEGLRRENDALEDELEQKTEQYRQMLKSAYQDQ